MFLSKYKILILLTSLMLVMGACGTSSQTQSEIATSVAQTVQAQNSLTEVASLPTITPAPPTEESAPTPNTAATPTSTPASVGAPGCTVSASLVGENPPDNVLLQPGENFWKTWTLQNTGTCTWDLSYKLVYWSGDAMGALTSYSFPEVIAPNESKDVSIYLKAPETEGTFTGYWQIQTPWGANFGVGPTSTAFYVQVSVSNDAEYGISNVTYNLVRDPAIGCPTNVRYTVYATITTNGPYIFSYFWDQSDGNESSVKSLEFTEAGSKTLSRQWMVGKGDSPNPRWIMFIVTEPRWQEYGKSVILNNCP